MTENKNVETILKNGDKALSGMPYLYRSKGLPSEVYDVRLREGINGELLKLAIADTVIRYPYFGVRFIEKGTCRSGQKYEPPDYCAIL